MSPSPVPPTPCAPGVSKRFVTTGTRTVRSKSRKNPQVKLKSPSCDNVGLAVAEMPENRRALNLAC